MTSLLSILLGVLVVLLLTALTGVFVAQEFAYMAVDRSRLQARADAGDATARRVLTITGRTSFMLSGAQLGITVTGLTVGYVAEPLIGEALASLLGTGALPRGAALAIGTVAALAFSTVVQMVFGELFPKNLAIARPGPVADRLARPTAIYLAVFGWLVRLFDAASNLLLRAVRIEPVHDVEHAATPGDLRHIVEASQKSGDLPAELSALLDRTLDLPDRTARHAMVPRTKVATVAAADSVRSALATMADGYSVLPVLGLDGDDVVGVLRLRDLLGLDGDTERLRVRDHATPALLVPATLPLPEVLRQLRSSRRQVACVADEYGGLAGVISLEDIAEEVVGEISDEHDAATEDRPVAVGDHRFVMPGGTPTDEVERLVGHRLPVGSYETVGGLVTAQLARIPEPGDVVVLRLDPPPETEDEQPVEMSLTVDAVERHVPATLTLTLRDLAGPGDEDGGPA